MNDYIPIKSQAKFMLLKHQRSGGDIILGGLFTDLMSKDLPPKDGELLISQDELWMGNIIIEPMAIFKGRGTDGGNDRDWLGLSFEQKLASDWGNYKKWEKQIFKELKDE